MNTFLPYHDPVATARALDLARLGKQLVECQQLLNVLRGRRAGYAGHPAARMWRGHEDWLADYASGLSAEWLARRGRDHGSWLAIVAAGDVVEPASPPPWWWGDAAMAEEHRRNLVRKDPARYGALWPGLAPLAGYRWPVAPGEWLDLRGSA